MKSTPLLYNLSTGVVTTCVVVWIEINYLLTFVVQKYVTTCVVVWIEIRHGLTVCVSMVVTTCVVVWIEIATEWGIQRVL